MWAWAICGALVGAMWLWRGLGALIGMRKVPELAEEDWDGQPAGRASVIVPARNEQERVEATLRSLLALDYPEYEIIAVDDRSTDATGAILDRLAAEAPKRLRVLHIRELPPRWLGKTHAMWTAAQQASGKWLLFTDADVEFKPDSLRRAVVFGERSGTDHAVVFPEVATGTTGGHAMLAFFWILFLFSHRPWKIADPKAPDYMGFGPFNLIRRSAYEKIGTWEALRLAVVEDMKLGEMVKRLGLTQRAASGQTLVRHYWAHDTAGVIRNLTKNFFAVAHFSWWRALGACGLLLFFNVAPYVAVALAPGWTKLGFAAGLGIIVAIYAVLARRPKVRWWYFVLHPVAGVLFIYIMLRSMSVTMRQGGVVWRGTKHPLDELRREMV